MVMKACDRLMIEMKNQRIPMSIISTFVSITEYKLGRKTTRFKPIKREQEFFKVSQ